MRRCTNPRERQAAQTKHPVELRDIFDRILFGFVLPKNVVHHYKYYYIVIQPPELAGGMRLRVALLLAV
jgi:hypothetical protein